MRSVFPWAIVLASCGKSEPGTGTDTAEQEGCSVDSDADGLTDCDERDLYESDPEAADTDGDGTDDGAEIACGSDLLDPDEVCYTCGWRHDDPGTLVSTGASEGDVIENLLLADQCNEELSLWDFTGEYYIMFMTAAW